MKRAVSQALQESSTNAKAFVNFAIDGVLVKMKDIMYTIFSFLDKKLNYLGTVNNKHSVKNHYY